MRKIRNMSQFKAELTSGILGCVAVGIMAVGMACTSFFAVGGSLTVGAVAAVVMFVHRHPSA